MNKHIQAQFALELPQTESSEGHTNNINKIFCFKSAFFKNYF
jgi:hypothetical protein